MFGARLVIPGVALFALLVALGAARPSSGASPEARYVVVAGDTLWGIAEHRYAGDIREAVWRIEQRNELDGGVLQPGQTLILP